MMGRWTAAALVALAWSGEARAGAPQSDPLAPPAVTVSAGEWAFEGAHPADGDTFRATAGTWSGIGNTYGYQWQRCTGAGTGCTDIPGATSATLTADSLFRSYVRVAVTATNPEGSATAYSAPTAQRLADELAHLLPGAQPVAIQGRLAEGETLTLDPEPSYTGSRPLAAEVAWERCEGPDAGHPCTALPIENGRNASYVLTPGDVGRYVRAKFHVFNGAGHGRFQVTGRVGPVGPNTTPPANTAAPTVSGSPVDGATLQAAAGSWTGARPMTYELQWLRCDGDGCTEIPGATISQYRAGEGDLGRRLRVRVTARNAYGSGEATSAPTEPVAPAPPAPAEPPQVSGTALDGQDLAGRRGSFTGTGPMTETVAWERCDASGGGCDTIAGAAAESYSLVPADIGHRLRFKVIARNDAGAATARSAATEVVRAIAPSVGTLPAVTGVARDEQALAGTTGEWTGSPEISFARQWLRCGEAGCIAIAGASGATYEAVAGDVGSRLRLRVTASNFGNSVEALSEPTAVVAPSPPRAVSAPVVEGEARDGAVVSVAPGGWKGTGPLSFAHRWERCADGAGCTAIAGAEAQAYRLAAEDVGHRVRAVVIATGPGGTERATSAPTHVVAARPPAAASPPEVRGVARDGATLEVVAGTWNGTLPMRKTVRWERCDPGCSEVGSGATYTVEAGDVGARLRAVELAENAAGAAESASSFTAVVAARPPETATAPAITGIARDGETLSANDGDWRGTPQLVLSRQWLRCSAAEELGGCEPVPGATAPSLALGADDVGGFVRVRVTAANAAGAASATSEAAGPVLAAPPAVQAGEGPALRILDDADQSAPDVGDRVAVEPGRWAGTARATVFSYRWERCGTDGCREIAGRTGATETVTAEDAGRQLRVVVTAANPAGAASQATPRLGVTRAGAAPAAPATASPAASGARTDALPAGSLLTPDACQSVSRLALTAGGVRLAIRGGTASAAHPLVAELRAKRPPKRIALRAGARAVRVMRAGPRRHVALLQPAVIAKAQLLQLTVTPRNGRRAKASARLLARPCQSLLTVRLKGRRLELRVDQRGPLGRVAFTLPKGLAIRAGSASVRTLPAAGALPGVLLAGRTLTLPELPPGTAAATLGVDLAGRARRGRALRFSATTGASRLAATASVRR